MVVPVPTPLLDLLLAANLTLSVAVLLTAVHAPSVLSFSTFPSLLVVSTLVRLSLNVSSTRLILSTGDAGRVIAAFGEVVVQGNLWVGALVFVVLAVIQWTVIAQGGERLAEVSARFALDALPGQQQGVDAQVRAGLIDAAESERRRRQLTRDSQVLGAMDGALKFVKGDVVAGFVITVVNLLAGTALGITQRGESFAQAAQHYGLLSIGDGLVSQLPSLLTASAAALLVTRFGDDAEGPTLGEELATQLTASTRALRLTALLSAAIALAPAMPTLPFALLAAALWWLPRLRGREGDRARRAHSAGAEDWTLSAPAALLNRHRLPDAPLEQPLQSIAHHARDVVFERLGVWLPACGLRADGTGSLQLLIRGIPARSFEDDLDLADAEALGAAVATVLMRRAPEFLGLEETQARLDELSISAPATISHVVPRAVSVPILTEVLRRLVEEGVTVRDLKLILEAIAQLAPAERDPRVLSEHARTWLRGPITFELTGGHGPLRVIGLAPTLESVLRGSLRPAPDGWAFSLSAAAGRDVAQCVSRASAQAGLSPEDLPIILTKPDLRRPLYRLLASTLPTVRVITASELLPDVEIRVLATAQLENI